MPTTPDPSPGSSCGQAVPAGPHVVRWETITAALEAETDAIVEAGSGAVTELLGGLVDDEFLDALGDLHRRRLAAARFELSRLGEGDDRTLAELLVRRAQADYRSVGGDPDTVGPDHVRAWVYDPDTPTLTYGIHEVPVEFAHYVAERDRFEARYGDVAEVVDVDC